MVKAKKPDEERLMGKVSGAVKHTDGSITLAPMYRDSWAKLDDRDRALGALIESVNRYATTEWEAISAARREWWNSLFRDHEFDPDGNWNVKSRGFDLLLTLTPPKPPADPPATPSPGERA